MPTNVIYALGSAVVVLGAVLGTIRFVHRTHQKWSDIRDIVLGRGARQGVKKISSITERLDAQDEILVTLLERTGGPLFNGVGHEIAAEWPTLLATVKRLDLRTERQGKRILSIERITRAK